jgi:hypothetical protein
MTIKSRAVRDRDRGRKFMPSLRQTENVLGVSVGFGGVAAGASGGVMGCITQLTCLNPCDDDQYKKQIIK